MRSLAFSIFALVFSIVTFVPGSGGRCIIDRIKDEQRAAASLDSLSQEMWDAHLHGVPVGLLPSTKSPVLSPTVERGVVHGIIQDTDLIDSLNFAHVLNNHRRVYYITNDPALLDSLRNSKDSYAAVCLAKTRCRAVFEKEFIEKCAAKGWRVIWAEGQSNGGAFLGPWGPPCR